MEEAICPTAKTRSILLEVAGEWRCGRRRGWRDAGKFSVDVEIMRRECHRGSAEGLSGEAGADWSDDTLSLLGEVIERPSGPTDMRDPMLHVSDQPA